MAKDKYIHLNSAQKEEIRRLTQLANRKIAAGHKNAPKERFSDKYALSRSTKFTSRKEYQHHLKYLKSFEQDIHPARAHQLPKGQPKKTKSAAQNTVEAHKAKVKEQRAKAKVPKVKAPKNNLALSETQIAEFNRLTQLTNRRIKAAFKAYETAGREVVPRDLVGDMQLREYWKTGKSPLSRSLNQFKTEEEFKKHMKMLREFEYKHPTMREYNRVQREKTIQGVISSLGEIPEEIRKKINKMTAPELADFWGKFSDKASRLGAKYSSAAAMNATLNEFFPEDMDSFNNVMSEQAMIRRYIDDMK